MPANGGKGFYEYFEDFLVTAIGDLPEIDIQAVTATGVTAILANAPGGVVRIGVDTSNDDDVAAVTGNLNWTCDANGYLVGEWRVKWNTSVADMFWFIGFGDSIATADETTFGATGNVYDILTMTDAVGFVFDNDATTPAVMPVAGKTDALSYQAETVAANITNKFGRFTPVVDTYYVFRVEVGPSALAIEWSINGEVIARTSRAAGDTTSYVNVASPLTPGVWNYEQAVANEIEMDYLYARKSRRTGDAA